MDILDKRHFDQAPLVRLGSSTSIRQTQNTTDPRPNFLHMLASVLVFQVFYCLALDPILFCLICYPFEDHK